MEWLTTALAWLNGAIALSAGCFGLSLFWGAAHQRSRLAQLKQVTEDTTDPRILAQLRAEVSSTTNDVASRVLFPCRTWEAGIAGLMAGLGVVLIAIMVVATNDEGDALGQREPVLLGFGGVIAVVIGTFFLSSTILRTVLQRAVWLAEHAEQQLAANTKRKYDFFRSFQWVWALTLWTLFTVGGTSVLETYITLRGTTGTVIVGTTLAASTLFSISVIVWDDHNNVFLRRQFVSKSRPSPMAELGDDELAPAAGSGRPESNGIKADSREPGDALARILAAEPMPVPDDPQDLRIELDELHGRHG